MASDARAADPAQDAFRRACADLDRRLRAGEPVAAEEWVGPGGALAADADLAVELIFTEYVSREELGENPSADEFCARFPAHADRLRRLFGVDQLLLESTAGTRKPSADTPGGRGGAPAGRTAGAYELLERIGAGGMGVVYRGWHPVLRREVAVKLLRGGGADRLAREAEAVARLNHPNIVQLFEVGEQDGQPFLALEYVPGPNLRDRLAGRALPPAAAAALVETLARAVHHAHERGVVHRDLKPANVLLEVGSGPWAVGSEDRGPRPSSLPTAHGPLPTPKVTDFGLAALADADGHTATGQLVGTAAYMPPEQAEARPGWVGPAVDVYALGAILYECLTGRPPFLADTPLETIRQAVHDDPVPPRRLAPHVPRDLETVALTCLAKEPTRRYPSAAALADDLARVRDGRPVAARRASWLELAVRTARRRPAAAAALFVAVVAVAALVGAWATFTRDLRDERDAKANETVRANAERADAVAARTDAEKARAGADRDRDTAVGERARAERLLDRTRDLLYAAGVARAAAQADTNPHAAFAFLRDPEAVRPDRLEFAGRFLTARLRPPTPIATHARGVNALAGSRDGSLVVTAGADGVLRGWNGATGAPGFVVPDAHAGPVTAAAVSADGSRVVTGGADGAVKVWNPADPTRPTTLVTLPGTVFAVALTADGGRVAAAAAPPGYARVRATDDGTVGIWDVAGGKRVTMLPRAGALARSVAFTPDGRSLAVGYVLAPVNGELVLWDLAAARPHFTRALGLYPAAVAVSPDGRTIAAVCPIAGTLALVSAANGGPVGPVAPGPTAWSVTFSPDSRTVALGLASGQVSTWSVATGTRTGVFGEPRPLPPRPARTPLVMNPSSFTFPQLLPADMPEGVAGVVFADGGRALAAVATDGALRVWTTDPARLRRDLDVKGYTVRGLVPLGADVLLGCDDGKLRRWNPRTGAVAVTAENLGGSVATLAASADGTRVAAAVTAKAGSSVHVIDAATGAAVWAAPVAATPWRLAFTPDGSVLAGSAVRDVTGWDAATGRALASWQGGGPVSTLAPGPAPGLVWASAGNAVVAVDPRTGREERRWPAPAPFTEAAFDPTGRLVAVRQVVASATTALVLVPAEAGAAALTIGGEQNVLSPVFSPDGRTLAAIDYGRVRLWHAATGQELLSLDAGGSCQSAAFSADGAGLAVLLRPSRRVAYWCVQND